MYVRLHGKLTETVQAYNDQVLQLYDMPVLVKRVQGKGYHYYVTGKDTGRYENWGGNNAQAQYAQHGNQHSFGIGAGGSDVVWVFKKQFMPLLLYPYSGTAVRVAEDWYQWGDTYKHFTGSIVELGGSQPAIIGDSRFVTLYLNGDTNIVEGETGSLFPSVPFPSDVTPYINIPSPYKGIPLSAVLLTHETQNIAWNNIYDDIRPIYGGEGGEKDGRIRVYDDGDFVATGSSLNFRDGVSAVVSEGLITIDSYVHARKNVEAYVNKRAKLSFIEGEGIYLNVADNPAAEEISVTISTTTGGYGGSQGEGAVVYSDLTFRIDGILSPVTDIGGFVVPYSARIDSVFIRCIDAGSAGTTIVDVNKNGSTIFTNQNNRPTLDYDNPAKRAKSGTPDVVTISEGDLLTIDIDEVAEDASNLDVTIFIYYLNSNISLIDHVHDYDIPIMMGDNVNLISPGHKGYVSIPRDTTINAWEIYSPISGNIVVDVKKSNYSDFPTFTSIAGTEKPKLTSQVKNRDITLDTWDTSLSEGDIIEFEVESASIVTQVCLMLKCRG